MNSSEAPTTSSNSPMRKAIPTTANGGTNATAIAAPGNESETSDRDIANAPAAPAARAIRRSINVGLTRDVIWALSSIGSDSLASSPVTSQAVTTATPTPPATVSRAPSIRPGDAETKAAAAPMIGVINGEMSIAPITTAVESSMMPRAAIEVDNIINSPNRHSRSRALDPS